MADDLFAHAAQQDALDAVIAAETARLEAREKVLCAPKGKIEERRQTLAEITRQALTAELAFSRLKDGEKPR